MCGADQQVRCFFLKRMVTCDPFACVIAAYAVLIVTAVTDSRAWRVGLLGAATGLT
jgi:hypothetical protein